MSGRIELAHLACNRVSAGNAEPEQPPSSSVATEFHPTEEMLLEQIGFERDTLERWKYSPTHLLRWVVAFDRQREIALQVAARSRCAGTCGGTTAYRPFDANRYSTAAERTGEATLSEIAAPPFAVGQIDGQLKRGFDESGALFMTGQPFRYLFSSCGTIHCRGYLRLFAPMR